MQALAWIGVAVTFAAVIWGKLLIAAAREFVKTEHPSAYEAMSDYGTPVLKNFSPAESRVRRALATKMLTGNLPPQLQADERMTTLAWQWRLCLATMVGGLAVAAFAMSRAA